MEFKNRKFIDVLKETTGFVSIGVESSSGYVYIERAEVVLEKINALDEYLKEFSKNKIKRAQDYIRAYPQTKKTKEAQICALTKKLEELSDVVAVAKDISRNASNALYKELCSICQKPPKWIAETAYKSINSGCGGSIKHEIEKERERLKGEIESAKALSAEYTKRLENAKTELSETRKYIKTYTPISDRCVVDVYDRISKPYGVAIKIEGAKWERGEFWTYDEVPEDWDLKSNPNNYNDEEEDA